MGLLDDAIREHLELKRRHGASDEEVERKAAEAFGPVRRERAEAEPAYPDDDRLVDEPLAGAAGDAYASGVAESGEPPAVEDPYAGVAEPPPGEPPAVEDPYDAEQPYDVEQPYAGDAPAADAPVRGPEPASADWDATDEPFADAPAPEPPAGGTPPRGFPAVEREPAGDDVLEETPDFLQDAPEHDRLWFEQKPPRDFDFDE